MFKLALVNPIKTSPDIASNSPPLNLMTLAAFVRKEVPIDIKIIDGIAGQDVKKLLKEFKPDLAGFTSTTPTILDTYDLIDWTRKEIKCKTVIGGVHASVMPDEALKHAHHVIIGEGEIALREIVLKMIMKEKITEKKIERPYIRKIDEIPMPAYDLVDMDFYFNAEDNTVRGLGYVHPSARGITILTSRGCPYKCVFCHNSWRGSVPRYNSPEKVTDEIKHLIEKYKVEAIFFSDDEFLCHMPRFYKIVDLWKKNNIKITWACQARADTVIRYGLEGLKKVKESGCSMICIGAESGNERILTILKAGSATVAQNREAIRLINEAGMKAGASFILGTPSETLEEMNDTVKLLMEVKLVAGGICIATPYPGTVLYKMAQEKGLISGEVDYNRYRPNVRPEDAYIICDTMPKEEFIKLYNKIAKVIGEKIVYNRATAGGVSLWGMFKSAMKRYPLTVLAYPFKHPLKSIKMVWKGIRR